MSTLTSLLRSIYLVEILSWSKHNDGSCLCIAFQLNTCNDETSFKTVNTWLYSHLDIIALSFKLYEFELGCFVFRYLWSIHNVRIVCLPYTKHFNLFRNVFPSLSICLFYHLNGKIASSSHHWTNILFCITSFYSTKTIFTLTLLYAIPTNLSTFSHLRLLFLFPHLNLLLSLYFSLWLIFFLNEIW